MRGSPWAYSGSCAPASLLTRWSWCWSAAVRIQQLARRPLIHRLQGSPLVLRPTAPGTSPQANGAGTSPQANGAGTSPQTEGAGTSPQTEGTGPESPQSPGNGGVSVPLAGLPIGGGGQVGGNQGNNECVDVAWLGQITHAGVVLTVTGVGFTGQFTTVDPAAAVLPARSPILRGIQVHHGRQRRDDGVLCRRPVHRIEPFRRWNSATRWESQLPACRFGGMRELSAGRTRRPFS